MNKDDIINQIRRIIAENGTTSTYELETRSSPCYFSLGKTVALVEYFDLDDVTIRIYNDDVEIDEEDVEYEELDRDLLEEILYILEDYEAGIDKTMKRIQS